MTNPDNETTCTFRLSKELRHAFENRCAELDRNKSQILRDLIRQWLNASQQPKLPL